MTGFQMFILFVVAFAFPFIIGLSIHKAECNRKQEELTRIRDAYYRGYAEGKRDALKGRR